LRVCAAGEQPSRCPIEFEALRADGLVDLSRGVYRASHISLYSSFRVASTLDPSTDKRMSRSTAIS
jgi:hypothetical protein